MNLGSEQTIWCQLTTDWLEQEGLDTLDALQRHRFLKHAASCASCSRMLAEVEAGAPASDIDTLAAWVHLAHSTLRDWAAGALTAEERAICSRAIEAHLSSCDFCADRLAEMEDWPANQSQPSRRVIAEGHRTRIAWTGTTGRASWKTTELNGHEITWDLTLKFHDDSLDARLALRGDQPVEGWQLSLPLSTASALLPTLSFQEGELDIQRRSPAGPDSTWETTPILTGPVAPWTLLVVTEEEPVRMSTVESLAAAAGVLWHAPLLRVIDTAKAPVNWLLDALDAPLRVLRIDASMFTEPTALGEVLGVETEQRELDLLPLLDELGVAAFFQSFKLIVREGDRTEVAAALVPRGALPGLEHRPVQFEIRFHTPDGLPLRHRPLVVRPGGPGSGFVPVAGLDDADFSGQARLVIREVHEKEHADGDED